MTVNDLCMINSMGTVQVRVGQRARSQITIRTKIGVLGRRYLVMMKRRRMNTSTLEDGKSTIHERDPDVIGKEHRVSNSSGALEVNKLEKSRNEQKKTRKNRSKGRSLTSSMSTLTSRGKQRRLEWFEMIQRVLTTRRR